jgi:5-methylcytosine-specific restriction endonuclease McrA
MTTRSADYEDYIRSAKWRQLRWAAMDRSGRCCERCQADLAVEVHHLTYERLGHERADDLEALCESCHRSADTERAARSHTRNWIKRLDGWATKVYGDNWQDYQPYESVEVAFSDWLERQ